MCVWGGGCTIGILVHCHGFVFVQIFKEEEEAVKVDLHEGCGRIKLYWTMALTDYRTLKGLVEFKEAGNGEISVL